MHQERNGNRLWLKKTADADAEHQPMLDDEGNPVDDRDISEHKKPRGQIAIDENLLRITFDAIQDGVSVLNKDLEILKVNKTLEQWYSHKMPFIGKKCYQVYQNYQEPCRLCPSIKAMEEKSMQVEIKPFTGEKNQIRWLELFSYPLMDDRGSISGVVEFVRDITERKQAQEEELNVYEQIVSSSNDLMALIDREYRYRIVNKAYSTRFNLNKGQIIGRHISEINGAGEFHNTIKPMLDRCFSGETVNYAAWFDIPDSGRRYLDVTHSPCYINETSIKGAAVVVRDITQRKQAEDALNNSNIKLQASEEKYRLLADNTPDHIFSCDREFRYTAANRSLCETLQLKEHEIIGKNIYELRVPVETVQEWEELLLVVFNTGKAIETETTTRIPDGTTRTYNIVLRPVYDVNGTVTSITGTSRDITERKKWEQEIFKADKLESIGTLAGGIAHDFNNYLAALLGNISLAKLYKDDPQKILEKLETLEQVTLRSKNLSNQLLAFAKGAAPVKETVSINQTIIDNVIFTLSGSNVSCDFFINEDLHMVEVDEGQFTQVLNNIVINARQAMPDGGEITLTAENVIVNTDNQASYLTDGSYVKISIQDEGIGIPKEHLTKIFDPFFTTKQKGSGLGLATSYSIIKNHGGHISVEFERGVGSLFNIYLPASPGGSPPAHQGSSIAYGTGKILVMDDQEDFLQMAQDILTTIGYDVSLTRDGGEAVESYMDALKKGSPFDLVIMDLTVPGGMGGGETIKELVKRDPGVKAIVSSGYSTDSIMANPLDYGFKGAIKKPFTIEELSRVVYEAI